MTSALPPDTGSTEPYVVGVDIGGTNFRMGAVARDDRVLHARLHSSRAFLDMADPMEALLNETGAFIAEMGAAPRGVCLGFPGTVSKDKTTVASCPNLQAFDGMNISAAFRRRFGVPAIAEHEVILLLSNDMKRFDLFGEDCVIAIYLGTGLGNALYIHGRFLEGKNGCTGELGHIPAPGDTAPCPCGNAGCIELRASGKRLEQIREEHFGALEGLDGMLAGYAGHPAIVEYLDSVACAVATEINILDPDVILLGGGVLRGCAFPYDALLRSIRTHVRKPYPEKNLRFLRVPQDPYQGIRGAGIYLWNRQIT